MDVNSMRTLLIHTNTLICMGTLHVGGVKWQSEHKKRGCKRVCFEAAQALQVHVKHWLFIAHHLDLHGHTAAVS